MAGKLIARLTFETFGGRKGYRVRFYNANRQRRSIWLGELRAEVAETWRGHVEHLSQCIFNGAPFCGATTAWLHGLSDSDREKLSRVGLTPNANSVAKSSSEAPRTLRAFVDWYISRRNVKPGTRTKWEQTREALVRYFGDERMLSTITASDAEAWREWLAAEGNIREGKKRKNKDGQVVQGRTQLADNTVRRRTGIARQFFRYAIKSKLITENPFHGLAASVHGNEARQFFITRQMFDSVIEASPGTEFEAILALSRIGGLRCPSEVMGLRWEDIDFAGGRIRIHAPKTEHHRDGGIRYCPLFVELRPFLENLAELAKARGAKPSDYVITENRGSETLMRRKLYRVLRRAGIAPWPKLFHNMRASRETELLDEFPIKDVCGWIGNSQAVAMKHYAMRREDSFARAAGLSNGEERWTDRWSKSGDSGQSEAIQSEAMEATEETQTVDSQGFGDWGQLVAALGKIGEMGEEGPELLRDPIAKTCISPSVGQTVGQMRAELRALVARCKTAQQCIALRGALRLILGR